MPRYLGVDLGDKRIGLAVGDSETRLASPSRVVAVKGDSAASVRAIIEAGDEYGVDAYVVGLPLNMDGTEGARVKRTRKFGEALAKASARPVHFQDERLSSVEAEEKLAATGLTRGQRKARTDRLAAQGILQDFLDGLPRA